jgi:hypothetical protein
VPGRRAQALQSIGVRGDKVRQLTVEVWVDGRNVQPAVPTDPHDGAQVLVTFFDTDRKTVGEQTIGLWREDFAWRKHSAAVQVPPTAMGMTVAVGLFGATGEFSCDDVVIRPATARQPALSTARR